MKIKLPETEEEYMKMLKMAFKEGQRSVVGVLRFEHYGDMEPYATTAAKHNFETWANQIWKYGLVQRHLLNDSNDIKIDPKAW